MNNEFIRNDCKNDEKLLPNIYKNYMPENLPIFIMIYEGYNF